MNVEILYYWGRRPNEELDSLFEKFNFDYQQIICSLGGTMFDVFAIELFLPVSAASFGEPGIHLTLRPKERRIAGRICIDWQAFSNAENNFERLRLVIDRFGEATRLLCERLERSEMADHYCDRIDALKYLT